MLSYWKKFIQKYSSDESFWYVHQSSLLDDEERILFELENLKNIENKIWNSDTQSLFRRELSANNIAQNRIDISSEQDLNAIVRGIKKKMSTLGLAYVNKNSLVKLTSAGNKFLKSNKFKEIIEHQLWKYIFYNPSIKTNKYKDTLIIPHAFLVEILLKVKKNYITNEEYKLFVCKADYQSDIDIVLEYINNWRKLNKKEQNQIITRLKNIKNTVRGNSLYNKINTNLSYGLSFFTNAKYILRNKVKNTINLDPNSIKNLEEKLKLFRENLVEINFEKEDDWIDFYGDYDKDFNALEALEYFEKKAISNKREYKIKALNLYKKIPKLRRSINSKEYEISLDAEIRMHKYFKENLDQISPSLKLYKNNQKDGYEYYIPTIGEIDLLCKEGNDYVVIEFKKNKASDKVIGQTLRYIGWIKEHMCQNNESVRGIIICRKYESKIRYAANAVGPNTLQYLETPFDTKLTPARI